MIEVTVHRPGGVTTTQRVDGEVVLIGSDPRCIVRIAVPHVVPIHAVITGMQIEARNGVLLVDGVAIERLPLDPEQRVTVTLGRSGVRIELVAHGGPHL